MVVSISWGNEDGNLNMLEMIMSKIGVGVAVLDESYKLVYCNDALCELFDLVTNNLVGQSFGDVIGGIDVSEDSVDGESGWLVQSTQRIMHGSHEGRREVGTFKKNYKLNGVSVDRTIRFTVEKMPYHQKQYCLVTIDDVSGLELK